MPTIILAARAVGGLLIACALGLGALDASPAAAQAAPDPSPPAPASPPQAAPRKPPPRPTTAELQRLIQEQRAQIEGQQALITAQHLRIADQEARLLGQDAEIAAQKAKLAEMEQLLLAMRKRLEEMEQQLPTAAQQKSLEERLHQIEEEAQKVPELPPNVVSAGDFPGSIRVPGTDSAIKFGGRIRTAIVSTLESLGSDDRFLTNSIPVEPSDEAAAKGARTSFSANTSRLNFEMRTPVGDSQMRAFIEGDFFGVDGNETRTAFRLRHAYAQFRGVLFGQTWSTFSDPAADHQGLDFEGINGENLIRQAQVRYTWNPSERLTVAAALETPEVSITGGDGVNLAPDVVGRAIWTFKEIGHLQTAVVVRGIRGESALSGSVDDTVIGWGASFSGVVPFYYFNLTDRFVFQLNIGEGNARYINDLNSLGGQDAVFNPVTGELEALPAAGFYLDYEHQWAQWERTRVMKLRSSVIWSFVTIDNLDFQGDSAYHETSRLSANLVFSPIQRIDMGIEYLYGTRENKNGNSGSSSQIQLVAIFRF